jgi:hypothetical protein
MWCRSVGAGRPLNYKFYCHGFVLADKISARDPDGNRMRTEFLVLKMVKELDLFLVDRLNAH